jgi:hypothetical protein
MAIGSLIELGGNLCNPAASKPSDYTVGGPSVGAAGSTPAGANKLITQTYNQESPRSTQDSGDQTPSVWGKADFPVGVSGGESYLKSAAVSIPQSVDFNSGQISPNVKIKSDV